jgi:N-acetyl-anhydromuramyl-L-alanine amidase AmpD
MRFAPILATVFAVSIPALADEPPAKLGERLARSRDEIMVCGQLYHTTTPVVLWTDPGGYDAYRVERRFAPLAEAAWNKGAGPSIRNPNRYTMRRRGLSPEEIERVRGGGWDLALLQRVVDQFVIHFDARGTSRNCFEILQDVRGLSVHFMLDLDGTIYQTLDLKESAQHATIANGRSVGVEIANIGAYPVDKAEILGRWYQPGPDGRIRIVDPKTSRPPTVVRASVELRPSRNEPVAGTIQGQKLIQYDLTKEQYAALQRLAATLCTLFPKIKCDFPHDAAGAVIPHKLPAADLEAYQGILGHYHVQTNKVDPGPAFHWPQFIEGTRQLISGCSVTRRADDRESGSPRDVATIRR